MLRWINIYVSSSYIVYIEVIFNNNSSNDEIVGRILLFIYVSFYYLEIIIN